MDTCSTCPFATKGAGLKKGVCSRGKSPNLDNRRRSQHTPEIRHTGSVVAPEGANRFNVFRGDADDRMQRGYITNQPKSSVRPQSASNLGNMKLIEQAIRDYGNGQGYRSKQTNLSTQRRPSSGANRRDDNVGMNQISGRYGPIESEMIGHRPRRVCQSAGGDPTFPSRTFTDQDNDYKPQRPDSVRDSSPRQRVHVQQGTPTFIEVRPPPKATKVCSSGQPPCLYSRKYSLDLVNSKDKVSRPQNDTVSTKRRLSVKGTDCGVCVAPNSSNQFDNEANQRNKFSNEYNRNNNTRLKHEQKCERFKERDKVGNYSDFNTKESVQVKQTEEEETDCEPNMSKQSTTGSPACDYSEQPSAADTSIANTEFTCQDETEKPVQQTFEVSNNDTIVITPGLPTVIEVRSKGKNNKTAIQSIVGPCNESSPGKEIDGKTRNDANKKPGDGSSAKETETPKETPVLFIKNTPETTCKKRACSKCRKDRNKESRPVDVGRGYLDKDAAQVNPFPGGNDVNKSMAYLDFDKDQSKHSPYQPPQMPQYMGPSQQQYQPPAMNYPMQQYPLQYPPMYPGQCPYQSQPYNQSPVQPAPYSWNQYQSYPMPQQYPPIGYNLPYAEQNGGDEYYPFKFPDNSTCYTESEPSLGMFDVNGVGTPPRPNLCDKNYCT